MVVRLNKASDITLKAGLLGSDEKGLYKPVQTGGDVVK